MSTINIVGMQYKLKMKQRVGLSVTSTSFWSGDHVAMLTRSRPYLVRRMVLVSDRILITGVQTEAGIGWSGANSYSKHKCRIVKVYVVYLKEDSRLKISRSHLRERLFNYYYSL